MPTSWPNTITKGSPILASDIAGQPYSLRTVIDSHRQALGLPPYPWAEPVTPGLPIKAAHYLELYAAVRDLWDRRGIDAPMTWSSRIAPAAGGALWPATSMTCATGSTSTSGTTATALRDWPICSR